MLELLQLILNLGKLVGNLRDLLCNGWTEALLLVFAAAAALPLPLPDSDPLPASPP